MKREKGALLFLVTGGMELSWLYAWATFLTTSILHRPFPFPEAIGTFGLAAALTLFSTGKGWRVVQILGLQVLGFILAALRIVYVFNYRSYSFLSQNWLIEFFNSPRGALEWFILVLVLFWALLFWASGVTLARRSTAYLTICSRFDFGLAALFLLLLIKFLLLVKGGIKIDSRMSELSLFPFFIFSLLAIGLVQNRSDAQRDFLPACHGIGVILSFTVVVLLLGTGLVLFFLPYLTLAAKMGYGILKSAAEPLGPILVSVIYFFFMHGRIRPEKPFAPREGNEGDLVSPVESSWWTELLGKILGWGFLGLLGLIVLIISGFAIFYLVRWLFSRTSTRQRRQGQWDLVALWAARLRAFLLFCWGKIGSRGKQFKGAVQLYTALLGWGRHSGLPHFLSETPMEYGLRLKHQFPAVKKEIELIIEAFNQEVYGEIVLNEQQLAIAQVAWHRLRSPLHWPSRLKIWFLQPGDKENIFSHS